MRDFLQLLSEKFMKMPGHRSFLEKLPVLAKSMVFRFSSRNESLFATFSWKVHRNAKTWEFVGKDSKFWPNRWFLVLFHEIRQFLQLFPEKFIEMQRHGSLFEKLQSFDQIDDFSRFFTKWGTFCNLLLKSLWKCKDKVVCSKSSKDLAKSMIFRAFSRNEAPFATFSRKVDRNAKTW